MDKQFFINPKNDPDYTISPFWFWNDRITDDKTAEQMAMMSRANCSQPVIHARSGLLNEYLSEDWFSRIEHAVCKAKELGMKLWLYDENNWPSGNCSWTITKDEKYREHYLKFECKNIKKGETFSLITSKKDYINITAYGCGFPEGKNLLEAVSAGDEIKFTADDDTDIYLISVEVDDYEPKGKFCLDYLSKEAVKIFIESTHEKYALHFKKEFGKTITGIFMDETRLFNAIPWTETFRAEFKARKGYDIVPLLPLLLKDAEKSQFVRYDYYDVVSDLMGEAMYKQLYDWCSENGIRTTGHFLGEETLASQSRYNGDIMRQFKYLHVPGIDHLGNGIGSLDAKLCSSAAHNYGKNVVTCESFGASGWDMTFEEMVKISNWLFQQGINQLVVHGFYYSIRGERKNDWPPSYFYQWKYWDNMPMFADMAARMAYMQRGGINESETLVYYPIETFWGCFEPVFENPLCYFKNGPVVRGEKARFMDNQFQVLCSSLLNENLDFELMNSDAAENFEVDGKTLLNKLTGARYKIFVLPLTELLPENMAELLNTFIKNGGLVLSYQSDIKAVVGKHGEHFFGKTQQSFDMRGVTRLRKISDVIDAVKKSADLPFEIVLGIDKVSRSQMSYPDRMHDPYIHSGENQYGIGVTRYLKDEKRILDVTNYNDRDESLVISVRSSCIPEIFIPETGEIRMPDKYVQQSNTYELALTIPANRAYFVVCGL